MRVRLAIGDFSRMTHLSVKALWHYHDVGVLVPAEIDPRTGYCFYEPGQVPIAQVIRRFRDLSMPLEEIKEVLRASEVEVPTAPIAVEHRSVGAMTTLAISDHVSISGLDAWWDSAFRELDAVLLRAGAAPAGPRGALYSSDYFAFESGGEVVAYIRRSTPRTSQAI